MQNNKIMLLDNKNLRRAKHPVFLLLTGPPDQKNNIPLYLNIVFIMPI